VHCQRQLSVSHGDTNRHGTYSLESRRARCGISSTRILTQFHCIR
jgi:hypothetical protein